MPTATPPTSTAAAIITSTRATASRSCSSPPACTATTTRSPTSRSTSTTTTWRGSTGSWPTWRCAWRTSITASWWTNRSRTRTGGAGSKGSAVREVVQRAPGAEQLAIVLVHVRDGPRSGALRAGKELCLVGHHGQLEIHLQTDGGLHDVGPRQRLLAQGVGGGVADQAAGDGRRHALGGVAAHRLLDDDAVHRGAEQLFGLGRERAVPAGEHDGHAERTRERGVQGELPDGAAVQARLEHAVGVGVVEDGVFRSGTGVVADAHRGVESAVDAFHHGPPLGVAAHEDGGLVQ